jgi:hypothetical protein
LAKFAPPAGAGLAGGRNLSASLKYTQQFSQIFALNNMQSPNGNNHRFSPYRWTRPAMHSLPNRDFGGVERLSAIERVLK